jgi:hypothetical protein
LAELFRAVLFFVAVARRAVVFLAVLFGVVLFLAVLRRAVVFFGAISVPFTECLPGCPACFPSTGEGSPPDVDSLSAEP